MEQEIQKQTLPLEKMQISSEESLAILEKIEIRKEYNLQDIRNFGTPPISGLVKGEDRTEAHKLITALIWMFNQFLNVSWTDYQLAETAKEFYQNYYYWTQLDLKNFFLQCRRQELKPVLLSTNQFSPFILLEWAKQYDLQWIDLSETISGLEHDKNTYDADRETQLYNHERLLQERKKNTEETIKRMGEVIKSQQERIEKLKQ